MALYRSHGPSVGSLFVGGSRPPYDVDGYSEHDLSLGGNDDESFGTAETSSAWFLKPWVLALWGLTVVILIGIIVYGLIILATGNGGGGPATTRPSTTTSHSTTPARATTPSSAIPTTTAPPPETMPEPAPPQITQTWTQQHPRHHWWNGNVPQIPGLPPMHVPGYNP
jgi:hypothetical protein